jgi:hypothetical protein
MNIQLHDDYVYTRQLDLNLADQKHAAYVMYEYIASNFRSDSKTDYNRGYAPFTTNLYAQFNYFLYPIPGLHELFKEIKKTFYECYSLYYNGTPPKEQFYTQAWLNVYRKGEFIDWHSHWPPEFESWHGFYCVDVEPDSSTTYRVFGRVPEKEDIVIASSDNLLVLSRSDGDTHRSSDWHNEHKARITVAFDIIPMAKLYDRGLNEKNHWVPI